MLISLEKTAFDLGEGIPVQVSFENPTAAAIVREDPSKSLDVEMHLVDSRTEEDLSYLMGKVETTPIDKSTGEYAMVMPPEEEIEIEAGSSFVFTTDVNENAFLHPGDFLCFLDEYEEPSNSIRLSIRLSYKSVDLLLAVAGDENEEGGRREWAGEYLQELNADFELLLPLEEDCEAVREEKEVRNRRACQDFLAWWQDSRDGEEVEERLKELNERLW
jgi:hypothetical protein